MSLTTEDIEYLRTLSEKLHWLKIAEDNTPELYLDNHMLQTFRACEAHFVEDFIYGRSPQGKVWFLNFGSAFHKMVEIYYLNRSNPNFSVPHWATAIASKVWYALDMEYFKDTKEYKNLGGLIGFTTLLMQYSVFYNASNERFRVIGSEIYFGKNKEVPICPINTGEKPEFRLFLSGKIDLLIDDGETICPLDHKTTVSFGKDNVLQKYEIQDGMTGYIYATRKILEGYNNLSKTGGLSITPMQRKAPNKIRMNYIQVTPTEDLNIRFKRIPMYKTDQHIEDYRLRQIRTGKQILQLLLDLRDGLQPTFNTMMCLNYMHRRCGYFDLHRHDTQSRSSMSNLYPVHELWNPESPTKEDSKVDEVLNAGN